MPSGFPLSEAFIRQLEDKAVREAFVADQVRARIAMLIRVLREQPERGWSQSELGQRMGKRQSVVSRIEDPDYGKLSLQTLLEVAAAFDLPLLIDMPNWSEWMAATADHSAAAMHRRSFNVARLVAEARAVTGVPRLSAVTTDDLASIGEQSLPSQGQTEISPTGQLSSEAPAPGGYQTHPAEQTLLDFERIRKRA